MTLFRNGLPKAALLAALLAVGACASNVERMSDSKLTLDTPIDWWHDLQGGKIAEVRPPPPGVDDPYPNLSRVPPRPTPTDPATRRALAARLVAERDRTEREAAQDPLVLPAPAAAPVAAAPAGPAPAAAHPAAPPPDPGASVAVLDAATAPPPAEPPTPPATAPATSPLPAAAARPPAATAPDRPLPGQASAESGPIPDLPSEAPPLPRLRGLPASVNASPMPRLPPGVSVAFRPGSAALPAAADAALRELAGRRAGAAIAVAAGGDAAGPGAAAQARALPLAWRRARGMQDALVAAGVPAGSLRVDAAALGRGGEAHLIQ